MTKPREEQGLLEDMLDPETVQRLKDAQDPAAFELVGADLAVDYRCPFCGYEWSGNPKPPANTTIEDATDGEA